MSRRTASIGGQPPKTLTPSESSVVAALRAHFDARSHVVIPQVRDAAGFGASRTADVVVMSLWPSRGLDLMGMEIKCSRSDWLRELNAPEKAETIYAYCDRWYLVVTSRDIVKDGELPGTWGLLLVTDAKVREVVPARPLTAKPMTRTFLAALLKRASAYVVSQAEIDDAVRRTEAAKEKDTNARVDYATKHLRKTIDELQRRLAQYEQAFDVSAYTYDLREIGARFKQFTAVVKSGMDKFEQAVQYQIDSTKRSVTVVEAALAELRRLNAQQLELPCRRISSVSIPESAAGSPSSPPGA